MGFTTTSITKFLTHLLIVFNLVILKIVFDFHDMIFCFFTIFAMKLGHRHIGHLVGLN